MSNWKDKTVVVTGGTKGLGLAITMAFAKRQANVVVLSRDEQSANKMLAQSNRANLSVRWIQADITSDESVATAVENIVSTDNRVDAWINNAGKSTRAAASDVSVEQCREFMEINFYAVVRCTQAVLPYLQESRGHLVNISSLAGKTAWPNTTPYSTSKHATTVYTRQLQVEGSGDVHYLLVCPGPIKRDDANSRYMDETQGLSESANRPGAGAPLSGIEPAWLADKIVTACEKRKLELIVPFRARLLFAVSQLFPKLGDYFIRKMVK